MVMVSLVPFLLDGDSKGRRKKNQNMKMWALLDPQVVHFITTSGGTS